MEKIQHYVLPEHTNTLYKEEAISSIGLTRDVADKINELVDAFNTLSEGDLRWKQTQEGIIRKGVLYMKDNLINTLTDLLQMYDYDTIKRMMMEAYGKDLRIFVTPQMFGAVGDGITNDIEAIEKAIASLSPGDTIYFPKGTYLMKGHAVVINKDNITFEGEGLIKCDYGFRVRASHFNAFGVRMECVAYGQEHRAFYIDNATPEGAEPVYLEDFTFKDCYFKNFFYSVCAVGGAYNYDGTEEDVGYPVRDLVIENCHSVTYSDQNAGHFQCIQVENIAYINNRTYGGKNASSYNAIKGNGYIRVIGNYDHNNSYASCEIENGSGDGVVANNTFGAKIWIDDSYDIVVNGNTTDDGILITVGSNNGDAKNIVVSNNVCKNIRCEQFGTYAGGLIKNINIHGNNVKGDNTHGIWIHGNAVQKARITNNFISGTNTNDIAIQRNAQLICFIQGNFGNDATLLIAGTGGEVFAIDNYGMMSSGNRDSLEASHLERAFNGLKVLDTNQTPWRINVSTEGTLTTTKY